MKNIRDNRHLYGEREHGQLNQPDICMKPTPICVVTMCTMNCSEVEVAMCHRENRLLVAIGHVFLFMKLQYYRRKSVKQWMIR
jgi:hypothetical protein